MSQACISCWVIQLPITNRAWVRPGFVNYKKGALNDTVASDKFTSCLPMVGGSLWVFRLLPRLKLVEMIQLKVALSTKNLNHIGDIMVSVLASSVVDLGFGPRSNQRLLNWYLLLLHLAHSIKEKKQRLVGSESDYMFQSGATCLPANCCFSELAL